MNLKPVESTELRRLLNEGVVTFAFKKIGGDLRTAKGTTQLDSIPQDKHPRGIRESSPKVVPFYDLEKSEWRSVSIRQEIFIKE